MRTPMELPELLMSVVFLGTFIGLMFMALQNQAKAAQVVKIESVVPNSMVFVAMAVGILCFLHFVRRLNLKEAFGIEQASPLETIGWAAMLIMAALPVVGAANLITMQLMKDSVTPQPLIELFNNVAREGNHVAVAQIFVAGVILAPCCEEFLFRGFFYGVWKRYLGPLGAGLLVSALFAAFHTSLSAFAGLFVLAVCLNMAYERTGSLLVPIGMHALFNFSSLFFLYVQAHSPGVPAHP